MGPDPAVAAVRLNIRRSLTDLAGQVGEARRTDPGGVEHSAGALGSAGLADPPLVLAACSGGADSLAMAAALAFEAPRLGLRAGAVTVDHGLQPGSAEQATRVVATLRGLGLETVH